MEKLFKLVCANFALKSRKPLLCHTDLENKVDDANIMFVGIYLNGVSNKKEAITDLAIFMKLSVVEIHKFSTEFDRKIDKRFNVKKGLIRNGLKLWS